MNDNLIPYPIILAAKNGVPEAMSAILIHNAERIRSYSRRIQLDKYGNPRSVIDTEIRDRIVAKLIDRIIYDFDPYHLPEGETLEE